MRDLRVEFPAAERGATVKAVDGVSFDIFKGETFGLIGESGSGKTTIGRAVVHLVAPTGGAILHDGIDAATLSARDFRAARRAWQIVFQDPNAALNPRSTILSSVMEPLESAGQGSADERRRAALQALARVGLPEEVAARYPHQLSGGQKQRVVIARTLTMKPELIVCDEVVAALDMSIRGDVLNLFAEPRLNHQTQWQGGVLAAAHAVASAGREAPVIASRRLATSSAASRTGLSSVWT